MGECLPPEHPGQDAIPVTKQHFRVEVQIFLSAVHRALSPSGTFLPRSPQMIMNRYLLTMVHMTQTVAFTVMIMGNPAAASPPRESRPPYWP